MEEWMLNDLLECSVCLERLDISSRVLPCQHTFCKKCLEEIITTHKELRCPECRVLVSIKLEDLPPNVLLMRILEGMKNVPKAKPAEETCNQQQTQDTSQNANVPVASVIPQQQQPAIQQNSTEIHNKTTTEPTSKNPVTLHQPCAKALYDYVPQESGDLAFKKGDIITLKKRVDANWYHGEKNGLQGFFPASYVQILTPLPNATVPQCVALYDFKMSAEDEKDCLTFNKAAVVTVIRRVDENWAEGRLSDRIGIFPISFVEMNSAAKHLMKSSMNFQPGPSRSAPALPVTSLQNSLNLMTQSSSSITTASTTTTTTSTTSQQQQQPTSTSSSESSPSSRALSREKRFSLNVNQQPQSAQYHRRSVEISNRNQSGLNFVPDLSRTHHMVVFSDSPPTVSGAAGGGGGSAASFMTPPALYIALYPYKPQKADELELRKGALYTVSEKCQDGWFKGSSVRTQKIGVFPGNYVQAVRSQPHPQMNPPQPVASSPAPQTAVSTASSSSTAASASSAAGSVRSSTGAVLLPPPKLPPRALSPAAQNGNGVMLVSALNFKQVSLTGSTSSSASVPASVVARLATTPAPAPALSPRATTLISPPPNVVIGAASSEAVAQPQVADKKEKEAKEKSSSSGVSLMKRLTSRKKSSPPLLHPYSIDNPVFEDGFATSAASSRMPCLTPSPAPVHVRSGSCPSQLLQVVPGHERPEPSGETRVQERSRHSMGGSQRLRSNKHRPNILPHAGGASMFGRSFSVTAAPISGSNHETVSAAAAAAAASSLSSPRDKDKRPRNVASPVVTERFRCITPYPPNSEYELELRIGDIVYVHKKRDDGWYKGTLHRTGKTGLFPASFVESC